MKIKRIKSIQMFDLSIICNFNIPSDARRAYLHKIMEKWNFIYLGKGRHRMTFLSPNKRFVLKFPRNRKGLEANRYEAITYKKALLGGDKPYSYAPCRLIQNAIILMVAVTSVYGGTEADDLVRDRGYLGGEDAYGGDNQGSFPSWIFDIDSCQVGRLSNGKLVAYDYGDV
jgi:hypothetical protein